MSFYPRLLKITDVRGHASRKAVCQIKKREKVERKKRALQLTVRPRGDGIVAKNFEAQEKTSLFPY